MDANNIFSSHYLAPIEYYFHLIKSNDVIIDVYENYVKQTYRNRACILSPNGVQNLTIPLVKARQRKLTKNMLIAYDENWRKMHWKSLEAGYRSSPYFEFYEDEFYPFFHEKEYKYLIDFNEELQQKIIELLNIDINIIKSTQYMNKGDAVVDYRNSFSPKIEPQLNFKLYIQVFGDRNGFAPNMSILDLLFNEGPNSVNYINELKSNV
ncbi:MAG: WbqC family protein [Flavobacteriales bacterium]|nr:WbqC family protein [Flavobacteriales bacterium]